MTENIYTALAAAQMEMGAVTKGATNPAFKSLYADLSDVASVVIPAMASKGVAVLHYIRPTEGRDYMRTEFVHGVSSTRIWCDVPLIVDKGNMQGYKSATTYAKRIGLESLSGVAPSDDDGNAASKSPPVTELKRQAPEPTQAKPATDEAITNAIAYIAEATDADDITVRWKRLPTLVGNDKRVIDACKARKAELANADDANIPYEGK